MEQLLTKIARAGIRLALDKDQLQVTAPPGALTSELRQALRDHKGRLIELLRETARGDEPLPSLVPDLAARAEPFPLTDLQHAFWLGRDSALEMGNVATHLYVELDCEGLSIARLNNALCSMIDRHDMLRAIVDTDGMQRILPAVPRYQIPVDDRSASSSEEAELAVRATRDALSHQVLAAARWPLFDVRATRLPAGRLRLHVSLDLLILDAWSIFLLFKEWHELYENPESRRKSFSISFRDYVLAEQSQQNSAAHKRAYAYWMERVEHLPPAPDLPLRTDPAARQKPRFHRREAHVDKVRWMKLKAQAGAEGLTPSGLLLAAYSEVLARWSATPHFTLNLTVSNRLQMHEEINHLMGEFTSVVLLEADRRNSERTFVEFGLALQQQFASDMDHREVSGLVVLREWAKRHGSSPSAAMPVVFSSGLIWHGDEEVGDLEYFGKKVFSVSQTSQVWLDQHVLEVKGDLILIWDSADAVFEDGVLDAMFAAYCELIERLTDDPAVWSDRKVVRLPEAMGRLREETNRTARPLVERSLHAGFVEHALNNPGADALLSPQRTMSYGELLAESTAVADFLLGRALQPGQPVAVLMHKGWEQVVAVYGVLLAGGAYVPIDGNLPAKRHQDLLALSGAKQVLTQPGVARETLSSGQWDVLAIRPGTRGAFGDAHARSLTCPREQLAYIIFTSGTTGVPKGVMIDHQGAMNTIAYVNQLFGVGKSDRVLAVSSLSFDLSVYDVFGLLDVGGAVVIPNYEKGHDPAHWRELICQHQVTLWNSAPQLMQMLTDSFYPNEQEAAPLQTVLLSGDFIPLDLPDALRHRYPNAKVISLGGATEASIWSNYYPIGAVDPTWLSIPYGKPLPNQTLWVYDKAFQPCPDHVRGRIFLGGSGLAKGYWRDPVKSAARFIIHPESGQRLYDTGDLGRYMPTGDVLILGRDDRQIKIRGHRVELGEIEAVLHHHPGIKRCVVVPTAMATESRHIVAYLERADGDGVAADPEAVKSYVAEHLPDYMVPRHVMYVDGIPISANGKIDCTALPSIAEDELRATREVVLPRSALERTILDAWSRVVVDCEIGVTDNFFDLGGDSVLATQLVRQLNAVLPFKLEIHELFENLTVESLAAWCENKRTETTAGDPADASLANSTGGALASQEELFADIRLVVDGLAALDFTRQPSPAAREGASFVTGGTGWIGAHVIWDLLRLTRTKLHCLVRAANEEEGMSRLLDNLAYYGLVLTPADRQRLQPLCGDLTAPHFGLSPAVWGTVCQEADSIYHLGASVSVLANYASHRKVNVLPLISVLNLGLEDHVKSVFVASPMAVCTRHRDGRTVVLSEERPHLDPDGLLTGYSQSKWVAEQVLMSSAERGLPVKIYRCSHALPSTRNGQAARSSYTYESVLRVAGEAGVVPDWSDSGLYGVPVDILSRLLVESSLEPGDYSGIVHLENHHPLSIRDVVTILLGSSYPSAASASCVSRGEWKALCLEVADRLPDKRAMLAKAVFSERAAGTGVENMFGTRSVDTQYYASRGRISELSHLTPPDYWRMVFRSPGWQA